LVADHTMFIAYLVYHVLLQIGRHHIGVM